MERRRMTLVKLACTNLLESVYLRESCQGRYWMADSPRVPSADGDAFPRHWGRTSWPGTRPPYSEAPRQVAAEIGQGERKRDREGTGRARALSSVDCSETAGTASRRSGTWSLAEGRRYPSGLGRAAPKSASMHNKSAHEPTMGIQTFRPPGTATESRKNQIFKPDVFLELVWRLNMPYLLLGRDCQPARPMIDQQPQQIAAPEKWSKQHTCKPTVLREHSHCRKIRPGS